jgi:hypothetical protein
MLGKSSTIKKVGEESSVTSACIRANIVDIISYPQSAWVLGPEHVNTVFFAGDTTKDASKVLIKNDASMSPLRTAAYIKLIGMFYGLEGLATSLYDEIAANYRCVAATVNVAAKKGTYPTGHVISAVRNEADSFMIAQNAWWNILANNAGVPLVDVMAVGSLLEDHEYAVATSSGSTTFATDSWAVIDTTQYTMESYGADSIEAERLDKAGWLKLSGTAESAYAVKRGNVYLADKSFNKCNRHSKPPYSPLPTYSTSSTSPPRDPTSSPQSPLSSCPLTPPPSSTASPRTKPSTKRASTSSASPQTWNPHRSA